MKQPAWSATLSFGFVFTCRLSTTQTLRYGSQVSASVPVMGGTLAQFSRLMGISQLTKLDWMGAACQVGGAVYGGLCGMYSPANITSGFQATVGPQLMGGAILILRDIGWQHRAWIDTPGFKYPD